MDDFRHGLLTPGLTRWQFLGILIFTVLLFLFVQGPIWEHFWEPDGSILYSYIPIPFLVAGFLYFNKTLTFKHWAVSTSSLLGFKYLFTATVMIALLFVHGPREAKKPAALETKVTNPQDDPYSLEALAPEIQRFDRTAPSEFDEDLLTNIEGTVVDQNGAAIAGALVYISSGLDSYYFKRQQKPAEYSVDSNGFHPPVLTADFYQPITISTRDGLAHTAMAASEGRGFLLNRPLMRPCTIHIPRRAGGQSKLPAFLHISVNCAMHPVETGNIFIFSHPFRVITNSEGAFLLKRVPAGAVAVSVWAKHHKSEKKELDLAGRETARISFQLTRRDL
ncbi:MAG: hypothetical protein ACKVS6_05985 [Planctomycetota bacterium]